MQRSVEWPQLLALVGTITTVTLMVSGFACWLLWKAWQELAKLRADVNADMQTMKAAIDGTIHGMHTTMKAEIDCVQIRVRKLEAEQVLGTATREDFKDFQKAIDARFNQLRAERRDDMRGLHQRLNDFLMVPRRAKPPPEAG
jgi:hypothetical protein